MLPQVNLIQLSAIIEFSPHRILDVFNRLGITDVGLAWGWTFYSLKQWYFDFFKGRLSDEEFKKNLEEHFNIAISDEDFKQAWQSMLGINDSYINNFKQIVKNLPPQSQLVVVADLAPIQKTFFE